MLVGGIAGGIAGSRNPAEAHEAGRLAGANAVAASRAYIFAAAVILSVAGSWAGVLPGTKSKRPRKLMKPRIMYIERKKRVH